MILDHEIPEGGKIYFGELAKKKREIEQISANIFYKNSFEEMVTPIFSYNQIESMDSKKLIHLTNRENYPMNLRADSTIDIVKLMLKRIGRNSQNNRWFYIQPVYRYPSFEQHQIGAEHIGSSDLKEILEINIAIFEKLNFSPTLQLSNIAIPKKIAFELNLEINIFKNIEIRKILSLNIDWLKELLYLETIDEVKNLLPKAPNFLKEDLEKLIFLGESFKYQNLKVAPLYYTQMEYYRDLIFKFIGKNRVFARGGSYSIDNFNAVGFSIYTDELLNF